MEQIVTWKSPKKILFIVASLLILGGLLVTASLVDPVVRFADPALEKVIREKVGKPTAPVTRLDVLAITNLDASGRGIRQLDGIENLRRLATLNLENNAIENLSPLANLEMLSELNLGNNQITDLTAVKFRNITHLPIRLLSMQGNINENASRLSNIELLSELSKIEVLNLQDNYIEDITHLSRLYTLRELNLRGNVIRNLEPLTGLTNLIYLNIHSNPVDTGLDALSNLRNLETLIMRNVEIGEDFYFLTNLTKLQRLNIRNTGIADLSVIANLMQAGALQDVPETSIHASVDILEIAPLENKGDPYQSLRQYWDNISYPYPTELPYYPSTVKPPVFSHQSGFYNDQFFLTLSTEEPDGEIYYTLDGSEPSFTPRMELMGATQKYSSPILLQSRIGEANQISNIVTDKWRGYTPPGPVFKGNIVRVVVIDKNNNRSNVLTQSYFIDKDMESRYTFPIVSIATDSRNLFDDEIGIYTFGNLYQNIDSEKQWRNPGNFSEHGLKWERPSFFQMFSPDGKTLIAQNIGIRIHGGFSRQLSPKSIRLVAGQEYDEQNLFQYDFFPKLNNRLGNTAVNSYEALILRTGGNDERGTLFRDALAQSLLEHTRLDIQGYYPVVVFVNGEYWGVHNIRTRYDEHYFQTYHGLQPDEFSVLKNGRDELDFGKYLDQANNFSNLFDLLGDTYIQNIYKGVNQKLDDNTYQELASRIDIDNFITYYSSEIYFDNIDWPRTNMLTWAKLTDPNEIKLDAPYGHDGKLRWMVIDIDSGMQNPEHNNLERLLVEFRDEVSARPIIALLGNEGFKHKFINQFADHLNTTFREDVVVDKIDEFEALYYPEIEEHVYRRGLLVSFDTWLKNVEGLRRFALLRPTYQRQHIVDYFELPGIATVQLRTNSAQGYIRINTLEIQKGAIGVEDPSNWSGIYFQGVPVDITAIPLKGYRFVRWEVSGQTIPDLQASTISTLLEGDIQLTAIFAVDNSE